MGYFLFVFIDYGFDINIEAFIFGTLVVLVLTAIYIYFCKYSVNSSSIQGYNVWGKKISIQWGDIDRIKPLNFFGIKILKIYSSTSNLPIWFPLYINNMSKFIQLIQTYTNMNNPVAVYFNGYK